MTFLQPYLNPIKFSAAPLELATLLVKVCFPFEVSDNIVFRMQVALLKYTCAVDVLLGSNP